MERTACEECGGKIVRRKVDYIYLGENLGKFECDICTSCHEQVFPEKVFNKIENVAKEKGLWGLSAKSKVGQVGNSVAVTISKKIADFVNLKKGQEVNIYPQDKRKIVIELK
ncbi:AbrB/MazE/SpoVT family DNA-binding domain-containing protein [Candidatus Woesearchaeota archaeon]|nr:AbrB/MazE/SpoVT family DNA-binding domain-containing protein [Candidatus Woesearchaeota archaeon]